MDRFIQGLKDVTNFDSKNNMLMFDDVMKDASNNQLVDKVFTQYVHHRNRKVI